MGQYHAFASCDRGEALYAHQLGQGLKLMEQGTGGFGGPTSAFALFIAPGGRWHGDRVAVVGDYGTRGDLAEGVPFAENPSDLYRAVDENGAAVTTFAQALMGEAFGISYPAEVGWVRPDMDWERALALYEDGRDDPRFGPLMVVNSDRGEYLDPAAFGAGRNLGAIAIRPSGVMLATAVLLAVSNGRGGGDLRVGDPLIGSWGGQRVMLGEAPRGGVDRSAELQDILALDDDYQERWERAAPDWLVAEAAAGQGVVP